MKEWKLIADINIEAETEIIELNTYEDGTLLNCNELTGASYGLMSDAESSTEFIRLELNNVSIPLYNGNVFQSTTTHVGTFDIIDIGIGKKLQFKTPELPSRGTGAPVLEASINSPAVIEKISSIKMSMWHSYVFTGGRIVICGR